MASPVVPTGTAKAVAAHVDYIKFGEGVSKSFGFGRHVLTSFTLGVGFGLVWKTWHWNEKRIVAQYYADLARKEAAVEAERQASIKAKFAELEAELLG